MIGQVVQIAGTGLVLAVAWVWFGRVDRRHDGTRAGYPAEHRNRRQP